MAEKDLVKRLHEVLEMELKTLSVESRKKYTQFKESIDETLIKLQSPNVLQQETLNYMINLAMYPLTQGCETKDPKIIKNCLRIMQTLISYQKFDQKTSRYILDTLWILLETGFEDVRILQLITLLITPNTIVEGEYLFKALVICFRMHFTKNVDISNTAGATVRQLVHVVFERVQMYSNDNCTNQPIFNKSYEQINSVLADAFCLLKDLINLVNSEPLESLKGITEMTRTFSLELIEVILSDFSTIFYRHENFRILLKDQMCSLIIKLFSPNVKFRNTNENLQLTSYDKPYFPICIRLLRVVSLLIHKYHTILKTECEIYLSLLTKFLENSKPSWQKAVGLEVIFKIMSDKNLLKFICENYDLKNGSTTYVLRNITDSLYTYLRSLFCTDTCQFPETIISSSSTSSQSLQNVAQPTFYLSGNWFPFLFASNINNVKVRYIELLDKTDVPVIADGYGISIAFLCLIEAVKSLSVMINSSDNDSETIKTDTNLQNYRLQLINSTWEGVLYSLNLLYESSMDSLVNCLIMKNLEEYCYLCWTLNAETIKDTYFLVLCKLALPSQYSKLLLSDYCSDNFSKNIFVKDNEIYENKEINETNSFNELSYKQIITMGKIIGPMMLTNKNIQAVKSLLKFSKKFVQIINTSWERILVTLQYLVSVLDLKPTTGGSLKVEHIYTDTNSGMIATNVLTDLQYLSAMITNLFDSTKSLEETGLFYLIDALISLSNKAMELAYRNNINREPSLFPVAKLLETGIMNMHRIEIIWYSLTSHLLEVCQHFSLRLRDWGVEAIMYLVENSFKCKHKLLTKENPKLQVTFLNPLSEMSSIHNTDIHQKQLECTLRIVRNFGYNLSHGWSIIFVIIGNGAHNQNELLIRIAFQTLQLIVNDFLPVMPANHLIICLNTVGKFASQTHELNISLTAIGLLWNISDYFYQNEKRLIRLLNTESNNKIFPDLPGIKIVSNFDKLWLCLFIKLSELTIDSRSAVRKSAIQTLFSTILAHGIVIELATWDSILWEVIFPILEQVEQKSNNEQTTSSLEKNIKDGILVHHSRNTVRKEWAETEVILLTNISKLINAKFKTFLQTNDFSKTWKTLLDFINKYCLDEFDEVSISSMKTFYSIIIMIQSEENVELSILKENNVWEYVWEINQHITFAKLNRHFETFDMNQNSVINNTFLINDNVNSNTEINTNPNVVVNLSQNFLRMLIEIFAISFKQVKKEFQVDQFKVFMETLINIINHVQITADDEIFDLKDIHFLPLHQEIFNCFQLFRNEFVENDDQFLIIFYYGLFHFSKLIYKIPNHLNDNSINIVNNNSGNNMVIHTSSELLSKSFMKLGEYSLNFIIDLYKLTNERQCVIQSNIINEILKFFHVPFSLKYINVTHQAWMMTATSFMNILQIALPLARKFPDQFHTIWSQLALTFNEFFFPKNCQRGDRSLDDILSEESMDCKLIELIRDEILSHSKFVPKEFLLKIIILLNKGSIHSATNEIVLDCEKSIPNDLDLFMREDFAKICFQTLLQFALNHDNIDTRCLFYQSDYCTMEKDDTGITGRLAVTALLYRFHQVIISFINDQKANGKCPLARHRISELSFVLKATSTLIISMKNSPSSIEEIGAWNQLIALYPYLVECSLLIPFTSALRPLKDVLLQYSDLLKPPSPILSSTISNIDP